MDRLKHMTHFGRHLKSLVIVAFSAVIALSAQAQTISKAEETLFEISDMYRSLGDVNAQLSAGLTEASTQYQLPAAIAQDMSVRFAKHLGKESLVRQFNAAIAGKLNAKTVEKSLEWYSSDLAKKFNKAEKAIETSEGQQAMMTMAGELMADQQRVAIEQNVLSSMNASEKFVSLQNLIAYTLAENIVLTQAKGEPMDMTPMKQQLDASKPAMKAQFDQFFLLALLYSHKDFSMEELKQYEAFNSSAEGRELNSVMTEAMVSAITQGINDMANETRASFQTAGN